MNAILLKSQPVLQETAEVHLRGGHRHRVVLAHQGDSRYYPSNTLPAFAAALEKRADGLELDVHWTKDNVIVVCHDEVADTTSNGHGRICDMTFVELRRLDFGYRFSLDGGRTFPFRNAGIQIPSLQEVLTAFPSTYVNIDIKPKRPRLAQFIREIYDCKAVSRVLAASFHHSVVHAIRQMNSRLETGASPREVASVVFARWVPQALRCKSGMAAFQVPPFARGIRIITEEFVREVHRMEKRVHAWTIDDALEMNRLLQLGVDGFITNDVALGVAVRDMFVRQCTA